MRVTIDREPLLERVLRPYRPDCRYLRKAEVISLGNLFHQEPLVQQCDFQIDESCYIDDTGHFNAVEFNICYNQMLYLAVATLVAEGVAGPFETWTLEEFWERQLPQFLIADFRSRFRRSITGRSFSGEIRVTKAIQRGRSDAWPAMVVLSSECRFWDSAGAACDGQVKVVVMDPPAP